MKILMAHDGSEHADKALDRAVEIAEKYNASLSVIMVATGFLPLTEGVTPEIQAAMAESILKNAKLVLSRSMERVSSKGVVAESIIEQGRPQDVILATAESIKADMIVIGSRGLHGVARFFLGSVSSTVADHAKCDVLIVK
jgi:nucleotide-binding universal stress UspA family protein